MWVVSCTCFGSCNVNYNLPFFQMRKPELFLCYFHRIPILRNPCTGTTVQTYQIKSSVQRAILFFQKIPQKNKEQQTNHPSISLSFRSSLLIRCDTMGEFFLDSFRPPNGILPSVANRMDIPLIVREHIFDEINLQQKQFSVEA